MFSTNRYEYLFLFTFFSSLQPVVFKFLSNQYDAINNLFMNQIAIVIFASLYLLYKYDHNKNYMSNKLKKSKTNANPLGITNNFHQNVYNHKVILYSIACVVNYMALNYSYTLLPITISVPISCLSMFSALYFNHQIDKTPVTDRDILSAFIASVGAIIVIYERTGKSFFNSNISLFGIVLLIVSTLCAGYLSTISGTLGSLLPLAEAYFFQNYVGWIAAVMIWILYVLMGGRKNKYPSLSEIAIAMFWFLLLEGGIIGITKFLSYEYFTSFFIYMASNIKIFFSLFFGYFLFQEKVTYQKILGCIIIFLSNFLVFT
jgi:drug/metabolite transporter (DMT)-like permease